MFSPRWGCLQRDGKLGELRSLPPVEELRRLQQAGETGDFDDLLCSLGRRVAARSHQERGESEFADDSQLGSSSDPRTQTRNHTHL